MTESIQSEHIAGAAANHEAVHEAHEFPNFIHLLSDRFHDSAILHFMHQWENLFFSGTILVLISSILLIAAARDTLIPDVFRNAVEALVEGIENFIVSILGEEGRKHVPFLGTTFLYIFFMNYCGLFPFFKSPTSSLNTTIPLALIAVCYIQYWGLRELGFKKYLLHIAGSPEGIASWIIGVILLFPLNIMLEFLAVPLSLSVRLFANVSSEDSLLYQFSRIVLRSYLFAFPLQLFGNALAFLFSGIQAFVFTLLTTVYIKAMMPGEHGPEHSESLTQPVSGH